jgi:serine-type D-Ala-D-Ala carboxypeptidase/endopeptidase (penicillin-binding protein 4)
MLELLSSGLVGVWLNLAGVDPKTSSLAQSVTWQGLPWLNASTPVEPKIDKTITGYIQTLKTKGLDTKNQAVWLRTESTQLADINGTIPVPAASLTKTATSLAAVTTWGLNKRFNTIIAARGEVKEGVLTGDLVIQGGDDPLFVWEDAIALAQSLNKLGITRVTGDLIVEGKFHMNYTADPQKSGELLKQALTGINIPPALLNTDFKDVNFVKLPTAPVEKGSEAGKVSIDGKVLVTIAPTTPIVPLIKHQSLPLSEIVRQMNIYSNNEIAQMLADSVGGAAQVMKIASTAAKFPPAEIQLINGSGLGVQNRLSPRAVCQIFRTLQQQLQSANLTLADLFPVAGLEQLGTLKDRKLPVGTTIKTGTLNEVSALSGVMPTRDRGLVWFVIINKGSQIGALRQQQDLLLQALAKEWGEITPAPLVVSRHDPSVEYFGDIDRNVAIVSEDDIKSDE